MAPAEQSVPTQQYNLMDYDVEYDERIERLQNGAKTIWMERNMIEKEE